MSYVTTTLPLLIIYDNVHNVDELGRVETGGGDGWWRRGGGGGDGGWRRVVETTVERDEGEGK